jgi:hypothetical protein
MTLTSLVRHRSTCPAERGATPESCAHSCSRCAQEVLLKELDRDIHGQLRPHEDQAAQYYKADEAELGLDNQGRNAKTT